MKNIIIFSLLCVMLFACMRTVPRQCGECPQLSPPGPDFCPNGTIVAGEIDSCGCRGPPKCELIACTADAKICPDGTAVGRVAPDCEFAPCPGE